jgi:hypothetical protein
MREYMQLKQIRGFSPTAQTKYMQKIIGKTEIEKMKDMAQTQVTQIESKSGD